MFKKPNENLDAFSLSLGGMTTVAGFAAVPAILHERLRKPMDEPRQSCRDGGRPGRRAWWMGRRQPA